MVKMCAVIVHILRKFSYLFLCECKQELMKAVAEMDLIQCMIGDVKVSTPGLYKNTKGKGKR